ESGNEYILWDNRWLDLPEVINLDNLLDSGGSFGYEGGTSNICRAAYIKQEYNIMIMQHSMFRTGLGFFDTFWDWGKAIITAAIPNRIEAENALRERMKMHDDRAKYNRN
ncbi:MAG: hypothetical protein EA393_00130, partial [Bacteroidetes bacterium]